MSARKLTIYGVRYEQILLWPVSPLIKESGTGPNFVDSHFLRKLVKSMRFILGNGRVIFLK